MSRFWQHFITNGGEDEGPASQAPQPTGDGDALDALSRDATQQAEESSRADIGRGHSRGSAAGPHRRSR